MLRAEPRLCIGDNPRSGWPAAKAATPQGMVARRKVRVWGMARIPLLTILETDENPVPGGNRANWRWVEEPAEEA
jgi:hypothetical protein